MSVDDRRTSRGAGSVARYAATGLLVAALLAGCRATGAEVVAVDANMLANGNTAFALSLYRVVAADSDDDANIFMSPLSVSTALTMTYAGARGNTATEMAEALGLPDAAPSSVLAGFSALDAVLAARAETSGYVLTQANSLWGQEGYSFRTDYLELLSNHFGAGLAEVDFVSDTEAARLRINAWVEDRTNDRIENLIPRGTIDSSTVLVLTNAIYFKGDWRTKFDADATYSGSFAMPSGDTEVPMMRRVDTYGYAESDIAQVLELPYEGGDLSMVVVLPKDASPAALRALESSLAPEVLHDLTGALTERKVEVHLPRFKATWGTEELADDLRALGIRDAFQPGAADFSGVDGTRDLFISMVLHKAFIEVNEEGSEAAAATAVGLARTSVPVPPPVFRADRPFLFMIRDRETSSVLFLGRLATP